MLPAYSQIRVWPDKPRQITRGTSRPHQIAYNCVLLLLAITFFVFAGLVSRCDGMPKGAGLVEGLVQASRYGPTVFPVVYALIVGGALRSLALWRLQEGERIGVLDLLLGSNSVGGMIGTQLERRLTRIDIPSLALLALWSLSPLGGQASFRIISYRDVPVSRSQPVEFLDFSNATFPIAMSSTEATNLRDVVDSSFVASLVSPPSVRDSPMDPWGNVKIPIIEKLPGYASAGESEWIPSPEHLDATLYSSLVGIPLAGIPSTGITNFTLETAYWTVRCPDFGYPEHYDDDFWYEKVNNVTGACTLSPFQCALYAVNMPLPGGLSGEGARSSWGWILSLTNEDERERRCRASATDDVPERQLFFRSRNSPSNLKPTAANCTIGTTRVEASVSCDGWDCSVDRLRRSQKRPTHQSPSFTIFDHCSDWDDSRSLPLFLNFLIDAAGRGASNSIEPGLFQNYLLDPNKLFNGMAPHGYNIINDLSTIGNESFATRFSQVLNGYWTAVYNFNLTYGGHPRNLSVSANFYQGYQLWNPVAEVAGVNNHSETRFAYDRWWMAVFILSASMMFLSGAIKCLFDLKMRTPNLLMNVSTMIRGNISQCPNVPLGGSTLDDSDRSSLLKDIKVRFGNIRCEDGSPGELGIGEVAEGGGRVTKATRDGTYW